MPSADILPFPKKYKQIEREHQKAVIKWASYYPDIGDYLIHIPNGEKRTPKTGALLKALGVKAGVHDLFLMVPMLPYAAGLWIEMKAPGKKLTESQKEFATRARKVGYVVTICYTAQEAINTIQNYLGIGNGPLIR